MPKKVLFTQVVTEEEMPATRSSLKRLSSKKKSSSPKPKTKQTKVKKVTKTKSTSKDEVSEDESPKSMKKTQSNNKSKQASQADTEYDFKVGDIVQANGISTMDQDPKYLTMEEKAELPEIKIKKRIQSVDNVQVYQVSIGKKDGLMKTAADDVVLETKKLRALAPFKGFLCLELSPSAMSDYFYTNQNGKNRDFFVEEWIPHSYHEWLSKNKKDFGRIWHDLVMRLDIMHNHAVTAAMKSPISIFYLDWKPENIRVRENGDVILIDFDVSFFKMREIAANKPMNWGKSLNIVAGLDQNSSSIDILCNNIFTRGTDIECLFWASLIAKYPNVTINIAEAGDIVADGKFRKRLLNLKLDLAADVVFWNSIPDAWSSIRDLVMDKDFKAVPDYQKLAKLYLELE